MKQDVKIAQNTDGLFDLSVADSDFESVSGFESAIMVSLFTDDRAPSSAVGSAARRRGWVGNVLTADIGRSLGSLLWLYEQSRLTQEIKNEVTIAAEDCLKWMIEDGVAKGVQASVTQNAKRGIVVNINITTLDGKNQRYEVLWRRTNATNI